MVERRQFDYALEKKKAAGISPGRREFSP